ncbi:MAG TPA: hypothetical protein DIW64_10330 [Cellvibrio sp.]|nr:hypothetical protein [Cellvibrio sp.]
MIDYFSTLMVCSGEYGNHILFACKSPNVDYERAPLKLKQMEKILNETFMPLFKHLEHLTA